MAAMAAGLGGLLWFGVDDTYSTVYIPMYAGIRQPPHPVAEGNGSFAAFTWDSAFWVFNAVANFTYTVSARRPPSVTGDWRGATLVG